MRTLLPPEGTELVDWLDSEFRGQPGRVARVLQYGVREGREAGEVVCIPEAFIANCNSLFILLEVLCHEKGSA